MSHSRKHCDKITETCLPDTDAITTKAMRNEVVFHILQEIIFGWLYTVDLTPSVSMHINYNLNVFFCLCHPCFINNSFNYKQSTQAVAVFHSLNNLRSGFLHYQINLNYYILHFNTNVVSSLQNKLEKCWILAEQIFGFIWEILTQYLMFTHSNKFVWNYYYDMESSQSTSVI